MNNIYFIYLFQIDFVLDFGPVCHTGLHLDSGPVPDKSFISDSFYHSELSAGHLLLHHSLFTQRGGDVFSGVALIYISFIFFYFLKDVQRVCNDK